MPLNHPARDDSALPPADGTRVELRAARIPIIGSFAHHHWFVIDRAGVRDRWEVWQFAEVGGTAVGHVHKNLFAPERGVGNGPSWVIHTWTGPVATELAHVIEVSLEQYPWRHRYFLWPGPNSNTYVQWLLGAHFQLGRFAPGRNFARRRPRATIARALYRE